MDIRVLLESDAAAWWTIRLESLDNDPFAFGISVEEHRGTTIQDAERRFRDVPEGSFHLGAFEGGQLLGTATFMRETGPKERHKGRVSGVYVSSAHRRKGVARALLAEVLERAKQDSTLEQILLSVATCQDAAQQLYRGFGFTTYGTEPNALKVGSNYVAEDHMILDLS